MMPPRLLPIVCVVFLTVIDQGLSLKCLNATNLPLPSLFKTVEECSSDQVCYIHKSVSNLYSGGCQIKTACPDVNPGLVGKREVRATTQCTECCTSNYCNNRGCGALVLSKPARGSLCFNCRFSTEPSQCKDVTMCKSGNVCTVRASPDFPGYYQQACATETACPATYKVPYCSAVNASCCADDFCNDACLPGSPPTQGPALTEQEHLKRECKKHMQAGYIYDSIANLCVKIVKDEHQTYTRPQAEVMCRQDNAILLSVKNVDEQDFLLYWIFTHHTNDTNYWISAKTKVNGSHDYYWADSSPVQYNHWGGGMGAQPDDRRTKDENCVFLNHKDRFDWHDDHCDARKSGYICEIWNRTGDDKVRQCRHLVLSGYFYDATSDLCIKVHLGQNGVTFTHQQAVDDCTQDGADLVSIDNHNKTKFIFNWIFTNQVNNIDFWIGATDKDDTSVFYWPNGQKLSYTHWGGAVLPPVVSGQPDAQYGITDENCVYLDHRHGYCWFDDHCTALKTGFICEIYDNSSTSLVQTCRSRLFDGYFFDAYSNECIRMFTVDHAIDRETARSTCKADGADLVTIDTSSKTNFILQWIYSQKLNGSDFWIGGKDLSKDGRFFWQHYEIPFTYTNWYTPTVSSEDCAYLNYQDTYHWKPSKCDQRFHGYICQIDRYTLANGADSVMDDVANDNGQSGFQGQHTGSVFK